MSDELDRTLAEAALTPSKTALRAAAIAAALGTVIKYRTSSTASETLQGVTHSTTTEGANIPGLLGSGVAIVVALVGIALAVRAKPMDPDASAEERTARARQRSRHRRASSGWPASSKRRAARSKRSAAPSGFPFAEAMCPRTSSRAASQAGRRMTTLASHCVLLP